MPWSKDNPPPFAKNYSDAEKKVASEAGNKVLARGGTEEEAIFSAIAAVKNYRKQSKASQIVSKASERVTPMHLQAVLNKRTVEPPVAPEEVVQTKPAIKQAFLGKNALQTGIDRNLVSVVLADNLNLIHTFDTGEQITTDLSKLEGTIENYVHLSTNQGGSSVNSKVISVNTLADVPLIVEHNLNLLDPEALIVFSYLNGVKVDIDIQVLDSNSIEIVTYVNTVGLKLNFLGL